MSSEKGSENERTENRQESRLEVIREAVEKRRAVREKNLNAANLRPDESRLKALDSSLKKNTAFIKKVKQLSEDTREAVCRDAKLLNLSKYVSEAASALLEAKLKNSDMNAAVELCSLLHQTYPDFGSHVIKGCLKVFVKPDKKGEKISVDSSEDAEKLRKRRMTLRLLTELVIAGIMTDPSPLVLVVRDLIKGEDPTNVSSGHVSLMLSFVKSAGRDLIGIPSEEDEALGLKDEIDVFVDPEIQKGLKKLIDLYTSMVSETLTHAHEALKRMERENRYQLESKGELTEEAQSAYDKARKSFDKLLTTATSLFDVARTPLPELKEDQNTTRMIGGVITMVSADNAKDAAAAAAAKELIWEDETSRAFYEDLPDLKPLLELAEEKTGADKVTKEDVGNDGESDKKERSNSIGDTGTASGAINDEEGQKDKDTMGILLGQLPKCVTTELADAFAVEFMEQSNKGTGKRLAKAMLNVHRSQLALIPFYARIAATISKAIPEFGVLVSQMVDDEFSYLCRKKDQRDYDAKNRNIRFIAELVKFGIAPVSLAFSCLKLFLDDFTHHQVDLTCSLLESCGRFLYLTPTTRVRMSNMLDIMWRLKTAKLLDEAKQSMIENVYYSCKPASGQDSKPKVRSPEHEYLRHLLYHVMAKDNVTFVLRQLRKFNWKQDEEYIIKKLSKVENIRFSHLQYLASVIGGLSRAHEGAVVCIVDRVLERIRFDALLNDPRRNQQRVLYARFLGELYVYRILDSPIIFNTLYMLIGCGAKVEREPEEDGGPSLGGGAGSSIDGEKKDGDRDKLTLEALEQEKVHAADTETDYIRIRLVCTLLDTTGPYFTQSSQKRRLDRFFLYFQRYILTKPFLPMDVEFVLQDTFELLRPKLKRLSTYQEACSEIARMEEEEAQHPADAKKLAPQAMEVRVADLDKPGEGEDADGDGDRDGDGDGDGDGEDETDGDSDSDRCLDTHRGHRIEDEEGEETEGGGSDDEVRLISRGPVRNSADDDLFDKELSSMIAESVEARKLERRPVENMAIPMQFLRSATASGSRQGPIIQGDRVSFTMLTKRGHKARAVHRLLVPTDSSLAANVHTPDEDALAEKNELKKQILEYGERGDEDGRGSGSDDDPYTLEPQRHMLAGRRGGGNQRQRRHHHAQVRPARGGSSGSYYQQR